MAIRYNCDYITDTGYQYPFTTLKAFWIATDKTLSYPDENQYIPQVIRDNENVVTEQITCELIDIAPRHIKLNLEGSITLHIDNPFQPATDNYFTLLRQVTQLPNFINFETRGEVIKPYKMRILLGA